MDASLFLKAVFFLLQAKEAIFWLPNPQRNMSLASKGKWEPLLSASTNNVSCFSDPQKYKKLQSLSLEATRSFFSATEGKTYFSGYELSKPFPLHLESKNASSFASISKQSFF